MIKVFKISYGSRWRVCQALDLPHFLNDLPRGEVAVVQSMEMHAEEYGRIPATNEPLFPK